MLQNPLNAYSLAFPVLEYVHIAGIVCGVGTAALVNLRLLGAGLTTKNPARLWNDTMPWTLSGLVLAIFSGLGLFSIDPEIYLKGYVFRFKMLALALAVIFYYTAVRKSAVAGRQGGGASI